MKVGIFADSHDHLDNIRRVVALFNSRGCETVLFAGDLVSTFAVPPLRQLNCPLYACFGDNEGNKSGLQAGFSILGEINEAPAPYVLQDGTRVVLAHMERQLRGCKGEFDVAVFGHTHKPHVFRDDAGRLWINPGETSGWTYGNPTVALLDTADQSVEIVAIDQSEAMPKWSDVRGKHASDP
jgi:putative phosphoesterase